MINWDETYKLFGYSTLPRSKRPKVVCECDECGKSRVIAVRVKSKVINGQMSWKCPSCVCLERSNEISNTMRTKWLDDNYRSTQLSKKSNTNYRIKQSLLARRRHINHVEPCITANATGHREIMHYLDTLDVNYTINDRDVLDGLELDIFIGQFRVAIEYNGVYWHSYNSKESVIDKNRHQNKALLCMSKGIRLIQLFDFEWSAKTDIAKSMIANLLGKSTRLNARDMHIVELSNDESHEFFDTNHMSGYRSAATTLALKQNNTTYIAASFSKSRDGYELIRLATKLDHSVRGGAGKLISHFAKLHGGKLYAFADLRYSAGGVYSALGFKLLKITKPGYFYIKQDKIMSRHKCQKHRLGDLLGAAFDPNKSESQNMFDAGYRRAWTAGNLLYVIDNSCKRAR